MQYRWVPVKGFLGQLRHELRVDGITVLTTYDTRLAVEPYTEPRTKATVVWWADSLVTRAVYGGLSRMTMEAMVGDLILEYGIGIFQQSLIGGINHDH